MALARKTGQVNEAATQAVNGIVERIVHIASSAEVAVNSLAQICTALSDLDHVTQSNAAMFEETTAASHTLSQGTEKLVDAVSAFVLEPDRPAKGAGSAPEIGVA